MPTIKPSRAMTTAEISDVIKRFVTTATILKKAGFHGIQLHGELK
jgi:2,4-dienoyl-CoA reductase-like NADH-dependent reductase (Old Yellow Enzyme family)